MMMMTMTTMAVAATTTMTMTMLIMNILHSGYETRVQFKTIQMVYSLELN